MQPYQSVDVKLTWPLLYWTTAAAVLCTMSRRQLRSGIVTRYLWYRQPPSPTTLNLLSRPFRYHHGAVTCLHCINICIQSSTELYTYLMSLPSTRQTYNYTVSMFCSDLHHRLLCYCVSYLLTSCDRVVLYCIVTPLTQWHPRLRYIIDPSEAVVWSCLFRNRVWNILSAVSVSVTLWLVTLNLILLPCQSME